MKKIFTLLAFLVVTVNAAAQYKGYLNVGDPDLSDLLKTESTEAGEKGIIEKGRLNLSGYLFYKRKGSGFIDFQTSMQPSNAMTSNEASQNYHWAETGVFKGCNYFFNSTSIYSLYNSSTNLLYGYKKVIFYITNCIGIDIFKLLIKCLSFYILCI